MSTIPTKREVFLDTSYLIAISYDSDEHHTAACVLGEEIRGDRGAKLITTHAVLMESGNAFSKIGDRAAGRAIIESLRTDPDVTILAVDDELFNDGLDLFYARPDKEWGLVDCVSFVVMQRRNLTLALTADKHFQQAGFTALLLD